MFEEHNNKLIKRKRETIPLICRRSQANLSLGSMGSDLNLANLANGKRTNKIIYDS
jgi:hypothetical protein